MSNVVTSLCRRVQITPTRKAVLMCIADYAHDDGKDWHSIAAIMEWTCLGRTAVIDALKGLEVDGLIAVDRRAGAKNTTFVQVQRIASLPENQSATQTGAPDGPVRQADGTGTPDGPPPVRVANGTRPRGGPEASKASLEASGKHQKRERTRAKASTTCPPEFAVTPDLKAWAAVKAPGIDIDRETEKFRLYERKKPASNWPNAWRTWMLNAVGFNAGRQGRQRTSVAASGHRGFAAKDYNAGLGAGEVVDVG